MSFPSTLLKIKRGEGWFAADRSWQSASHKLSDGAFKLFVYVSLAAERSTGRFVFRQGELAKALNKSRRSIGKYLRELEEKQLCQISLSSNQHATGTLQIRGDYWPYERSSETDALDSNRSAQRLFVEALEQMLLSRPCVSCRYSAADRQLAVQWFQQEVPLEDIEQAILLGWRTQVRLLAQWRSRTADRKPPLLQSHPGGGRRQPPFGRVSGVQSVASPAARTTLVEGPEGLSNFQGGNWLGKVFPTKTNKTRERRDDDVSQNGGITLVTGWGIYLGD